MRLRLIHGGQPVHLHSVTIEGDLESIGDLLSDAVTVTTLTYRSKSEALKAARKYLEELCGSCPVVLPVLEPARPERCWLVSWL